MAGRAATDLGAEVTTDEVIDGRENVMRDSKASRIARSWSMCTSIPSVLNT